MLSLNRIITDEGYQSKLANIMILSVAILFVGGILGFIQLYPLDASLSVFLMVVAAEYMVIIFLGKSLIEYRVALIRRAIIEQYRDSVHEKPKNIDAELDNASIEYKEVYLRSHLKIALNTTFVTILILLDQFLANITGLTEPFLLGLSIFRFIGIIGIFMIMLYFYRSYAEDPQSTLRENINNYKRVSATGRKEPQ